MNSHLLNEHQIYIFKEANKFFLVSVKASRNVRWNTTLILLESKSQFVEKEFMNLSIKWNILGISNASSLI